MIIVIMMIMMVLLHILSHERNCNDSETNNGNDKIDYRTIIMPWMVRIVMIKGNMTIRILNFL